MSSSATYSNKERLGQLKVAEENAYVVESNILKDPIGTYYEFAKNIRDFRPNSGMYPSRQYFGPIIEQLTAVLISEPYQQKCATNLTFKNFWEIVMRKLYAIKAEININAEIYPYAPAYPGSHPYNPTLSAIKSALELIDIYDRELNMEQHPDRVQPYYHTDRYGHYPNSVEFDYRVFIMPTSKILTLRDLILVRSVPIAFVGVVFNAIYADRHWQSPFEFYYHDKNHIRRMVNYIYIFLKAKGVTTLEGAMMWYKKFDEFITNFLLPLADKVTGDDEMTVAWKLTRMVIIFELLHESALIPHRKTLISELHRVPGDKEPFEFANIHDTDPYDVEKLEKLRTDTGNLNSGYSYVLEQLGHIPPTVEIVYFWNPAPSILANILNKLLFGFYDHPDHPSDMLLPPKFRTPEFIATVAHDFLNKCLADPNPISYEVLLQWTLDQTGLKNKDKYPALQIDNPILPSEIHKPAALDAADTVIIVNFNAMEIGKGNPHSMPKNPKKK
jgi:hypothetical protein